jgi:hypothetical protein
MLMYRGSAWVTGRWLFEDAVECGRVAIADTVDLSIGSLAVPVSTN